MSRRNILTLLAFANPYNLLAILAAVYGLEFSGADPGYRFSFDLKILFYNFILPTSFFVLPMLMILKKWPRVGLVKLYLFSSVGSVIVFIAAASIRFLFTMGSA